MEFLVFIILVSSAAVLLGATRKSRSKSAAEEDTANRVASAALLGVVMPQLMENSNSEMNEGKEEN